MFYLVELTLLTCLRIFVYKIASGSRIHMRLNVDGFDNDWYSHKGEMCTMDGKINMNITTVAFIESADGTLVVRMQD